MTALLERLYDRIMPRNLRTAFGSEEAARRAAAALEEAGVDPGAISVTVTPSGRRESSFIVRLVAAIVVWSLVGAFAGVGLGTLLWLAIGPSGTTGLVIQAVVWGIFGHLIAGMLAGYLLLADRTQEDLPHDRADGSVLLAVRCPDEAARERARQIIEG